MQAYDRVNIGCGPLQLPGWCNTDVRPFSGVELVMDATEPWPVPAASLSYVYGEHFLEHLEIQRALKFFQHAGASLRVNGRLRLSTPNLEWVILTHFALGFVERPKRLGDTLKTNRAFYGWGHHFLWSKELLEHVMSKSGFVDISFHAYGRSEDPNLCNLERHGGYSEVNGCPSVVIVEAARDDGPVSADDELQEWLHDEFVRHVLAGH